MQLREDFKNWFADAKKIVVAGIGNPIRSDDYVGLKIVQNLRGKVPETVCLLECETVPENYLSEIEQFKPTHVLLIDAAFLGLKPGEASSCKCRKNDGLLRNFNSCVAFEDFLRAPKTSDWSKNCVVAD